MEGFEYVGAGVAGAATGVGGDDVGGVTSLEADGALVVDDGLSRSRARLV